MEIRVQFSKGRPARAGYRFFHRLCSARMQKRFGHLRKQLLDAGRSDLFVGEPRCWAAQDLLELCEKRSQESLALRSNLAAGNETLVHLTENAQLLPPVGGVIVRTGYWSDVRFGTNNGLFGPGEQFFDSSVIGYKLLDLFPRPITIG